MRQKVRQIVHHDVNNYAMTSYSMSIMLWRQKVRHDVKNVRVNNSFHEL